MMSNNEINISLDAFRLLSCTQKRAVFKIAVELVKADNRIHSKELTILDSLQHMLELAQEDIDLVHYMTLDRSIASVKELPATVKEPILKLYTEIMKVDSDIDFEENLLLSSIVLASASETCGWAQVISTMDINVAMPKNQVIYLEKTYNQVAHSVLDDKYDNLLISKAFGDVGFQFFYLHDIINGLGNSQGSEEPRRFNLLQKSMEYLMPAGDRIKIENLKSTLESFDSSIFLDVVLSHLGQGREFFPFSSFILVKVRDGFVLDDNNQAAPVSDFLCVDLSADVKKRILTFVSRFDNQRNQISYAGYFKLLFDYLSSESRTSCSVVLDEDLHFCLDNLDMMRLFFESEPQSKSFYMALLRQGEYGITQADLNSASTLLKTAYNQEFKVNGDFSISDYLVSLRSLNTTAAKFLHNLIYLYQVFSTKDFSSISYIGYIEKMLQHKNSLKTYVNKVFDSVSALANADQYKIRYNSRQGYYYIPGGVSQFKIKNAKGDTIQLSNSSLWEGLK